MRVLGRGLIVLLLLSVAGGVFMSERVNEVMSRWLDGRRVDSERLDQAQRSMAYVLDRERWVEFPLSGLGDVIKVLSNASLPKGQAGDPEHIWTYALEYRLIGAQHALLDEWTYHHRTRVSYYRDKTTGKHMTRHFFYGLEQLPANAAVMRINLNRMAEPVMLRLRLAKADPGVSDVIVRVYQPNPAADHRMAAAWQRLSVAKREFMARGNVFGPQMLRDREIRNLLRNRHQPVGPRGVRGEDYEDRVIYSLGFEEDDLIDDYRDDIVPAGLFVDHWLRATVPVPEGGARVALAFTPVGGWLPGGAEVRLRWYGRGPAQRSERRVHLSAGDNTVEGFYDGGLLEIIAQHPLTFQARLMPSQDDERDADGPFNLRAYLAMPESPVDYAIDHIAGVATPFRVDLRAFTALPDQPAQPAARSVRYQLLNSRGGVVKAGLLMLEPQWSLYDRFGGDISGERLTEAARYYFDLPPSVATVRFHADTPALINAYTRPADLMRHMRLPEDHYPDIGDEQRQPAWFLVRPVDEDRLVSLNRSALLELHRRPPQDDLEILAGRYDWKSFQPEGAWLARHVLTPRDRQTVLRDEALGTTFREVSNTGVNDLELRDLPAISQVRPSLLYVREDERPMAVTVTLDGVPVIERQMAGRRGEITLPATGVGVHRLSITAGDAQARWLINHAGAGEAAYLKRLVHRIPRNGLTYLFEKTAAEEVLSARFFMPHDHRQRARLNITIDAVQPRGIGPFRGWTFTDRLNDVRPGDGEPVVVWNTRSELVSEGQPVFVPLADDLPPGLYRIRVQLEEDVPGYFSLYQLMPGQFDQRRFFVERMLDDAEPG